MRAGKMSEGTTEEVGLDLCSQDEKKLDQMGAFEVVEFKQIECDTYSYIEQAKRFVAFLH